MEGASFKVLKIEAILSLSVIFNRTSDYNNVFSFMSET